MYIELEHDMIGSIVGQIVCVDSLPIDHSSPMFWRGNGLPAGIEQSRINLDTLTALEINQNSGQKALIENGEAVIKNIDRTDYIRDNFKVDMSQEILIPNNVKFPAGIKMRKLIKK